MYDTVFDVGFNRGNFSTELLRYFNVNVVALEPEPSLFRESSVPHQVDLRNVALSSTSGTLKLFQYRNQCASLHEIQNADTHTVHDVKAITLQDLLDDCLNGDIALLKLDIEGAEMDVLESAPASVLMRFPQITVEFHLRHFPDHKERLDRLHSRLREIGFYAINFSRHDSTDVLFFQRSIYRFPVFMLVLLYTEKYLNGFVRVFRRSFQFSR